MHPVAVIVLVVFCMAGVSSALPGSGPDKYQAAMFDFARMLETNETWRSEFLRSARAEQADLQASTFNYQFKCAIDSSPATPTSVHTLRPQDVNVIAALGDSITAGNGIDAWTAITVLREKRGESWSIGGDKSLEKGVHTIANLLRKFNPGLKGMSKGYGTESSSNAWLNQAVPGAKAEDLPNETDALIKKMKSDSRIDFDNDWKLVTLLIGGNDLCDYCEDRVRYSPTALRLNIQEALDKLHAQVPRVLVNLVPMSDISPVPTIRTGPMCTVLHWTMCNCARNDLTRPELKPVQVQYYEQMKALASSGRYDTRPDFTVVLQPHLVEQEFPRDSSGEYDPSYIAPDCFHPNRKTHQGLSYFAWNAMLTPVGQKPLSADLSEITSTVYKCPTKEYPYIFTGQNSPAVVQSAPKPSLLHKIIRASKGTKAGVKVVPKVVSKVTSNH